VDTSKEPVRPFERLNGFLIWQFEDVGIKKAA